MGSLRKEASACPESQEMVSEKECVQKGVVMSVKNGRRNVLDKNMALNIEK